MALKLYSTLSRKKEVFRPRKNRVVNLFVCGPTVYDWAHIGHARTYIVFDMFVKLLRQLGYKVFYLENITDVDDKIIARAHKARTSPNRIAKKFTALFLKDMETIGINAVTAYAPASKFIPEILKQVNRLIRHGFAYAAQDGSVYFRVNKDKDYGKLSRQKLNALEQFEPGEHKEDPRDFALWKAAKPGEPKWKSPWASPGHPEGWGRPGWHIEDTAISEKYFGPQYDIHGGGIDLLFPHHECEITQQESASGKQPFVKYWMHTGHLLVKGTKMSKSLGNFITIKTFLEKTNPETLRLLVATHHYRSPIDYTDELLHQTETAHAKLQQFSLALQATKPTKNRVGIKRGLAKARHDFYAALLDDFNTPKALASLFALVSKLNPLIGQLGKDELRETKKLIADVDAILGIIGKGTPTTTSPHIKALVEKREVLRQNKRWQEADLIREKIRHAGWTVEDTPSGPKLTQLRNNAKEKNN